MKKTGLCLLSACISAICISQSKKSDTVLLQPIEIKSVRANDKAPFTKTNLTKIEIEKNNLGQDLPFILNQTPSVVINSDAGNGVGYTGIRIRGTDASRINMTINGIPYNDPESQGIYFVDVPDIISSVNSLQIQRGVGTSSNGGAAFGATLNLSTNEINDSAFVELNNSYGSFNTWKNTLKLGSGLLGNHFTIDGRGSLLRSDGYVDRAYTDLKSFYVSTAYLAAKNSLRLNIFSGKEKTYQSWYGISESDLATNRTYNPAGTEKAGEPYDNQTDNYTQTHYQLFYNQRINSLWSFNIATFFTRGKGYYEEYKAAQKFVDYGLPNYVSGASVITKTDLVRQLWLDNIFYGNIFSFQQKNSTTEFTAGGGWNKYDGKHYGVVKWTQYSAATNQHYYVLTADKKDFNIYTKLLKQLSNHFIGFADVQVRNVKYNINGFRHNPQLVLHKNYTFLNPKVGLTYTKNNNNIYLSYSLGSKEPNRDDFEAGITQQPKPEKLHDFETGFERKHKDYTYGITGYYMYYRNQLVLTGKINDVGEYTRTNTPSSYRLGVELQAKGIITSWLNASGNVAFSKNKIKRFTEYVDDYDNGGQKNYQYHNTDISFSPNVVGSMALNFIPMKNAELTFLSKYVGKQYLDNTSKDSRSLKAFYVQDARISYQLNNKLPKEINFIFQVNNIFNRNYEPNGYTFSYFYLGNLSTENYFFPMAGTNFMAGVNVKF